jgi:hypothetical protein
MTEHNDDFDRSLPERLRAHENRVPGGAAPNLDAIGSGASSRRGTGWGWGALVAGGGVAAGLILVLIFNGRQSPPTGQATATPHPTISVSPTATSSPTPSGLKQLSIVPIVGLAAEDELRAITQVDGRLIAVGRRGDKGAVWTSLDGASWTLAPDLPAEQADSNAATTMTSIVAGPGGLVAAGSRQGIDYSAPRTWQSADGQRWTSITVPSGAAGGRIETLAVGGSGYVGVGLVSDDGYTGRPQMWSSADGRAWTAVDSGALTGSLNDVIGGDGMLVAVGYNGTGGLALLSADGGATWTAAPEQEALQGAEMTSVTFGNGTFVATGLVIGSIEGVAPTPAIWRSTDGLHWTLVLRGEPGQLIRQAVSTDLGFVAIGGQFPSHGWQYDPAAPNPPRDTVQLWFSADGETWSGPITGFLADGGVTLGRAMVLGGDLLVPVTLLNPGPGGPTYQPTILRGPLPIG